MVDKGVEFIEGTFFFVCDILRGHSRWWHLTRASLNGHSKPWHVHNCHSWHHLLRLTRERPFAFTQWGFKINMQMKFRQNWTAYSPKNLSEEDSQHYYYMTIDLIFRVFIGVTKKIMFFPLLRKKTYSKLFLPWDLSVRCRAYTREVSQDYEHCNSTDLSPLVPHRNTLTKGRKNKELFCFRLRLKGLFFDRLLPCP